MKISRKNIKLINPYLFNKNDLEQAANALQGGGIVIHPTETVYGLAAVWNNESAIRKVATLKKRSLEKPFSILVNGIEQILRISGWSTSKVRDLLDAIFPAPLTLLLPRRTQLSPGFWNQFPEIGFRFPDFKLCTALVEVVGEPVITTSANIANQPPPKAADEIDQSLIRNADVFLNGGDCPLQIPSTVVRFNPDKPGVDVVRDGAFSPSEFAEHIGDIYG
jgi:L-threonylcarbamoyladenylate synthase